MWGGVGDGGPHLRGEGEGETEGDEAQDEMPGGGPVPLDAFEEGASPEVGEEERREGDGAEVGCCLRGEEELGVGEVGGRDGRGFGRVGRAGEAEDDELEDEEECRGEGEEEESVAGVGDAAGWVGLGRAWGWGAVAGRE